MGRNSINSTHIGAASIMLIFMVLGLISFATLTLVNSRADFVLSSKMKQRCNSYYDACHEANAFIARTGSSLTNSYMLSSSEDAFYNMVGAESFSESFPINDTQTLDITIIPTYPDSMDEPAYKVTSYRVVTHDDRIELDQRLPVMK
ncbi:MULTISPECIES: hypothetical protein [unclassified Butyrivibrio]|uniref:hypothetical protein n=1 Tax=unclassified Butyrivibrio TaxID=2639466 RepID=UPI0003F7A3ED|nr:MULTISPECIES: hypothetical protein [unclassified Butyrivibrio]